MGGVEIIPSAVIHHIDQHTSSIKKNFIFGMESVKFDLKWRNETDHSPINSIICDFKVMCCRICQILGVIYGLIKYGVFRSK